MLSYHYCSIFNSCSLSTQLYTYSSGTCGPCGSLIISDIHCVYVPADTVTDRLIMLFGGCMKRAICWWKYVTVSRRRTVTLTARSSNKNERCDAAAFFSPFPSGSTTGKRNAENMTGRKCSEQSGKKSKNKTVSWQKKSSCLTPQVQKCCFRQDASGNLRKLQSSLI